MKLSWLSIPFIGFRQAEAQSAKLWKHVCFQFHLLDSGRHKGRPDAEGGGPFNSIYWIRVQRLRSRPLKSLGSFQFHLLDSRGLWLRAATNKVWRLSIPFIGFSISFSPMPITPKPISFQFHLLDSGIWARHPQRTGLKVVAFNSIYWILADSEKVCSKCKKNFQFHLLDSFNYN